VDTSASEIPGSSESENESNDSMKDPMYLPAGSDDPDWSSEDIIPTSPNAMELSRLYIFQVSKTWRRDLSNKSQFIPTRPFHGENLLSDISHVHLVAFYFKYRSQSKAKTHLTLKKAPVFD
jgi:hypothetical protein